ncbi:uncharacterized protein LOC135309398 isoform X2 [Passer domesticus]|uniref:uncharacterized protein LOC135309398 isoform X2 n=1 Tax=Passer domesticus TaxID=48849 RepID=UPI0030FEE459
MAGRFPGLLKVFRGKNKKGPAATPAQQPEEPERIQTLQDDASLDGTQAQKPGRGRFHRTLKMFRKFLRIQRRETGSSAAEGPAKPDSGLTELQAEPDVSLDSAELPEDLDTSETEIWATALLTTMTEDAVITNSDIEESEGMTNTGTSPAPTVIHTAPMEFFEESAVPSQQQVPAIVRNIHQRLVSHDTVDARLQTDIVRLAEEHPVDVVLTLLRCAPTCDRAAAIMWKSIGSVGPALEKVLPTLLCVMEDWPVHSASTSDGDDTDVFALAATLVIWVIVSECHKAMIPYSGRLFVALLFHIVITTQQMPPEEAGHFWKACREEHRLPRKPSRFAVQAMKALLYRLRCDKEVMAVERKRGWDTLLRAHTQHYAVGLLAREMRRIFIPFCSLIALHLLKELHRADPYWDLPFLAFLVEVFECLDLCKCGDSILEIMSRCLQSECRERRRLALRALMVLSKDPLRDDIHMQLLSLNLFFKVMDLVVKKGKKPLKRIVKQSLLPLFFHCHDANERVAKASRELLLCVVRFLRRRKLKQLLKREKMLKFGTSLLAEDTSRAAEQLRRAQRYLQSPQEPLREAAIRFMGSARVSMRGQKEVLEVLNEAIHTRKKGCTSHCSRNIQAQFTS